MNFQLNKRHKIIISSALLTIGLLSTQLVDFNLRFKFLAGLSVLAYILSLWSLWEGLNLTKALILMILPTFFTLAVASFYFLLPVRWLTRLPVAFLFGLTFYLLLLAQNVFNVASLRTIPLYRAASTASFLFTLLSAFFIYHVVFAFNLLFLWNGVLVALFSFPLILQVLWSIQMEERISSAIIIQSFILSLILGELALSFSFWPSPTTIWSLALSSAMYVLLGLTTQKLRGKLNSRVVWEYTGIGVIVLLISFFTTSWTG
ncbi:hypothetical protein A3J19_04240 [Candidatus Daviesbacteria bacterium RIFCSPLOWO2_02_FULL_41_8]|uniref:Uncharacterized protein n=3 Tax=Candidatus Daviesiibacteriota TaxID=1752718 RepID=A0A1F5NLM2_9BACT|nr:MAG: hypothetical protein A2871_00710 [Candidatus Daviesbacteria bacterium RIFCSPHIGHO2_01_FULL_41_23]OGE33426.1 MAG: hypothetical protein A3D83_00320 [Candidatus Daviesbacteria bacterium RIFCSPHIGHO2_02_FULL_41_10]OGE62416.1 MAG: hypothetical protein A2967_01200 [Candidatus Daviesbacteria bacterium RIFCSPLOWO2_01_FULL_41_32]OGE78555.1 MAG: hypothetical protein A3J19_04240 [Candidatus Daviesbacteria bacterium RIFCSPLOWO2_02_FULL_41_8]